jgi:hypothetical protein
MTEEEAWALDDEVTRNPPNVAGKPGGFFTDRRDRMVILDQFSAGFGAMGARRKGGYMPPQAGK